MIITSFCNFYLEIELLKRYFSNINEEKKLILNNLLNIKNIFIDIFINEYLKEENKDKQLKYIMKKYNYY